MRAFWDNFEGSCDMNLSICNNVYKDKERLKITFSGNIGS